jgi:hypothetical protein
MSASVPWWPAAATPTEMLKKKKQIGDHALPQSVTELSTNFAAYVSGDVAESLLTVIVPARAAPLRGLQRMKKNAHRGSRRVVNVAALDVTTEKALLAGLCEFVPITLRRKWQPVMKPPSERQRYGLSRTVLRYAGTGH